MYYIKNQGTFTKLIILFVSIILPVLIIFSMLIHINNENQKKGLLRYIQQNNKDFSVSFEENIQNIYKAAGYTSSKSCVKKMAYNTNIMSVYEKIQEINKINETLTTLKSSYKYIDNAKVYIQSINKAYNAYGSKYGSVEKITNFQYEYLKKLDKNPSILKVSNGNLIMLWYDELEEPVSISKIELSTFQIKKDFENSLIYPKSSYYLFALNDENYYINNFDNNFSEKLIFNLVKTKSENSIQKIKINKEAYYIFNNYIETLNGNFIQIIPSKLILQPLQFTTRMVVLFYLIFFTCILLFFVGVFYIIRKPLNNLHTAFGEMETGDFSIRADHKENDDFKYLYDSFNNMAKNLNLLVNQNLNQKMLIQKAELKQLQAQINPHFLYNSFFMLQRMIKSGERDDAEKMSKDLGVYFRYITKNDSDFVMLEEEYHHAKIYSDIQSLRFNRRICIDFEDLIPEFKTVLVPKLFLQPILENAFNHGLENKISNGLLKVSFFCELNNLKITIEDNGDELSDEKISSLQSKFDKSICCNNESITGLVNIYKRFNIFYNDNSRMEISRSNLGGLKVDLTISNDFKGE